MKNIVSNFVETYTNKFIFKEVHQYFNKFVEPTKELARSLDKQIEFKIHTSNIFIAGEKYKKIFSSFLHIFRNIIDHGIESIEERLSLEKNERALIEITFKKIDQGLEIPPSKVNNHNKEQLLNPEEFIIFINIVST